MPGKIVNYYYKSTSQLNSPTTSQPVSWIVQLLENAKVQLVETQIIFRSNVSDTQGKNLPKHADIGKSKEAGVSTLITIIFDFVEKIVFKIFQIMIIGKSQEARVGELILPWQDVIHNLHLVGLRS